MMVALSIAFLVTALIYAAVGFGGGSTYNALLVLSDVNYQILPVMALTCNLIVVSGGCFRFYRSGLFALKPMLPWGIASVPAAWLGGYIHVSEILFISVLATALLASAIWMLYPTPHYVEDAKQGQKHNSYIAFGFGGVLGFVAGMVGIGGGIFLAPLLYALHWSSPKRIAATCSLFILINSVAGLVGQMMKLSADQLVPIAMEYGVLWGAVLIGGQIGALLGTRYLPSKWVKWLTAILILYVSLRLFWRLIGLLL